MLCPFLSCPVLSLSGIFPPAVRAYTRSQSEHGKQLAGCDAVQRRAVCRCPSGVVSMQSSEGALWVGLTLNEMRQKSNAGQGDGHTVEEGPIHLSSSSLKQARKSIDRDAQTLSQLVRLFRVRYIELYIERRATPSAITSRSQPRIDVGHARYCKPSHPLVALPRIVVGKERLDLVNRDPLRAQVG